MAGVLSRNTNAECRTVQTRNAECGMRALRRTGELRSQAAFSAKTLRAADLLPTAGVGWAVTARCGALRAARASWPCQNLSLQDPAEFSSSPYVIGGIRRTHRIMGRKFFYPFANRWAGGAYAVPYKIGLTFPKGLCYLSCG